MNENEYSHMVVMDLGNRNCKLQFIMMLPAGIPLKHFNDPEIVQMFVDRACYNIGYFASALKTKGLFLKEIEFIIPPVAEYMQLEQKIKEDLPEDKYSSVVVKKGLVVSWADVMPRSIGIGDLFNDMLDELDNTSAHNN